MKVACCQFAPIYGNIESNLDLMRQMLLAADADICIFPELATTGYFFKNKSEIEPLAEPVSGHTIQALRAMALEANKAIVTGFLESAGGNYYNSAIAIDCNGTLVGHYRKVHLFYFETQIFSRGDLGWSVFALSTPSGIVRLGLMICYDWRFPEAARALAIGGAELIAAPSNIVTISGMLHTTLQTRAFENKVALAFADRIGTETHGDETLTFRGESALINFNGEIISVASTDRQEILVAEFNLAETGNKRINTFNDIFSDRAPETYASIATHNASAANVSGEKKS